MRARMAAGVLLLFVAAVGLAPATRAAQSKKNDDPARAKELIEQAIAALGGPKYLGVTSAVATGVFTPFAQGRSMFPLPFVDTFVYPNKNRTDFGKKKTLQIQANAGDRGWKYDGARQVLAAQEADEVQNFQRFVRANIDNVLRKTWRDEGVTLRYTGRLEISPRVWTEGVAIDYPDGFSVEIYFDPKSHLPRLSRYQDADGGSPGPVVETRFHDVYLEFGGVMTPRTVDLYRDRIQTARLVYEEVRFNAPVSQKVFDQPASAKEFQ